MKITDLFAPFADDLQLSATPSLSNPPFIEWTSGFGDLFFRIKGADPQIVWCVLGRGAPNKRPLSKQRLATLNKYVSAAYAGRTFFRVVPFSDGDDWALVRPKRALVKSPTQKKGAIWQWNANFPAPDGQIEWLSQSLKWFESWLVKNGTNELQAAREFATMNEEERKWWPLSRKKGVRQEWEKLLPALQKLSCPADQTSLTWSISIGTYHQGLGILSRSWPRGYFSAPAVRKLEILLSALLPTMHYEPRYLIIGIRGKKRRRVMPEFTIAAPTQHEKLEAALLWRDFGREIGESERVEAALAQLLAIESSE